MSYVWPAVPVSFFTMVILKKRYLAFWSKVSMRSSGQPFTRLTFSRLQYNYVVSAAFSTAIALSGIMWAKCSALVILMLMLGGVNSIFFALQFNGTISLDWWGNAADSGCDATGTCIRLKVPKDPGYFGPGPGQFQ